MSLFLSYGRGDDEAFVRRLYEDLVKAGLDVWFDRTAMPSRGLAFTQEIRDAIAARERLLLVLGPAAAESDYVVQEWRTALEMGKCINPIVRLDGRPDRGLTTDGYALIPDELKFIHAEDFRDDAHYAEHLANLIRQLTEPAPPLGKLVAVPTLPGHYLAQADRLRVLRDALLQDLRRPVVVTGVSARLGLEGMGGIGKTVLATAIARDIEIRRAFPDGVFWVGVGQTPDLLALQRQLAAELGGEGRFEELRAGREMLRILLKPQAALLILDDVWRRSDVDAFDALGPRCRLLLTTRDAALVTALAGTDYQVQLPSQAEALQIIASKVGMPLASLPSAAAAVVDLCGRLPLALALCGGMVRTGTSWEDLLDALRERDLEFLSDEHAAEAHHKSMWRAIEASMSALAPEMRDRFIELAVFPAGMKVPESSVVTLWAHTGRISDRRARRLLVELKQRSLVEISLPAGMIGETSSFVSLHDLLQVFVARLATQHFSRPQDLEEKLLDAYRARCEGGWSTGPDDGYFLEHICDHLGRAGQFEQLSHLLLDIDFLRRTAKRVGSFVGSTGWLIAQFLKACLCCFPPEFPVSTVLRSLPAHIDDVSAALELLFVRGCGSLDERARCHSCGGQGIYHGHMDLGGVDFYDNYFSLCGHCFWAWHSEEYSGFDQDPGIRDFDYRTNTY